MLKSSYANLQLPLFFIKHASRHISVSPVAEVPQMAVIDLQLNQMREEFKISKLTTVVPDVLVL